MGELIIAGAGAQLVARRLKVPDLVESTSVLARLVEDVRDSALNLRMVQIGATFSRFRRVVRDDAAELGKDIQLEIRGGETELDKTVVEKIGGSPTSCATPWTTASSPPMCVLGASRGRAGCQPERLSRVGQHRHRSERRWRRAAQGTHPGEGGRARAGERRPVPADKRSWPVFEPGFSTAAQVSNLRGGRDVVKRNILALRGTVDLDSVEGQGTTVRLRLPLTLAIIDGFLIGPAARPTWCRWSRC